MNNKQLRLRMNRIREALTTISNEINYLYSEVSPLIEDKSEKNKS